MLKLLTSPMMLASHSTKRLACYSAVAAPEALTSYNIAQYMSTCVVRDLRSNMLAKCAPQPHALVTSAHRAITIALSRCTAGAACRPRGLPSASSLCSAC